MSEVFTLLLDIAPEFDATDPRRLERFIDYATLQVGSVFGKKRNLATALLAAHMLSMSERQGAGGTIASEKEGELSRSYALPALSRDISSTSYGQEFNRIARSVIFCPRTSLGDG